ncbi:putative dihydroorotase [Dissostichus eleginoides]|uniref:Dihydroorotase n=1 Tax=Dissostichus eleginoides TaxID=100907 RepID=A0AAD9CNJ7_DISEL|nr:putative dihydroorotase [Dissostichus eleginoides]
MGCTVSFICCEEDFLLMPEVTPKETLLDLLEDFSQIRLVFRWHSTADGTEAFRAVSTGRAVGKECPDFSQQSCGWRNEVMLKC